MADKNEVLISDKKKEAFLAGDPMVITDFGQEYLRVMGCPPIPQSEIGAFLKGSPAYLRPTGKGWGMATDDAIRCLFDGKRTKIFIKGIAQAVDKLKQDFAGEELVAIEAGCGTGILAVAMVYAGIDKVVGIEINPVTAGYTKKIIAALGLLNKIKIVNSDATQYIPEQKIHFILSENMHTGLFFEPQKQIISHLSKHLKPGGVVLPQAVELSFALAKTDWQQIGKSHIELRNAKSPVERIGDWGILPKINFTELTSNDELARGIIPLSQSQANALIVEMDVHILNDLVLESGTAEFLGQPHLVQIKDDPAERGNNYGFFYYQLGGKPPAIIYQF